MSELTKWYVAADDVCTQEVDDDEYCIMYDHSQVDAELQRHKRAIEWCLTNGAYTDTRGRIVVYVDENAEHAHVSPPSDIADLIKGER